MPQSDGRARWNKAKFKAKTQRERLRSPLSKSQTQDAFHLLIQFLCKYISLRPIGCSGWRRWEGLGNHGKNSPILENELAQSGLKTDTLTAINRLAIQTVTLLLFGFSHALNWMSCRMSILGLSILNLTFRLMSMTNDFLWPWMTSHQPLVTQSKSLFCFDDHHHAGPFDCIPTL